MLRKNRLTFIIIGLFLLAAFSGADDNEFVWTKNLPYESWMNVVVKGVKVGYESIYVDRTEYKGQSVLKISSVSFLKISRFGLSMEITRDRVCYIRDDFSPCYFLVSLNENGQKKDMEGTVEDNIIAIKTTLDGRTTQTEQTLPQNTVFTETLEGIIFREGLEVGNSYSLETFSLDLLKSIGTTVNVVGEDNIEYDGQVRDTFIVDYRLDIMGGVNMRVWVSPNGEVYKMESSILDTQAFKVSKKEALEGIIGSFDVLIQTRIELAGKAPEPGIRKFSVKARLSEGDLRSTFVNSHRQEVSVGDDPREGIIKVSLKDIDEEGALQRPVNLPELSPYLSPSVYIQSDDPDIEIKAQEIAGDEENSWRAAKKISKWVNRNIRNKNLKVGFGSARQTLKDLQGDCSEHTILFIALARALGIPARIRTGIVYNDDAFYYHFWPEVYIGEWISIDPSLGQIQADATHIQFASIQVETESNLELGEGVLRTLDKLQIQRLDGD